MGDDITADEELARLQTMHDRVEKLRSQLKDLQLDTYSALQPAAADPPDTADALSKNST